MGSVTSLSAEGGATYKRYDDDLPTNSSLTKRSFWGPQANLSLAYDYEEQSWLRLTAYSSLQDSASAAYAAYSYGAKFDLLRRLLNNAGVIASAELTSTYDTDAGNRARERIIDRIFEGGLEYTLREGLGLRALGGYEYSTAEVANGFQRWTASGAVNAVF